MGEAVHVFHPRIKHEFKTYFELNKIYLNFATPVRLQLA